MIEQFEATKPTAYAVSNAIANGIVNTLGKPVLSAASLGLSSSTSAAEEVTEFAGLGAKALGRVIGLSKLVFDLAVCGRKQ